MNAFPQSSPAAGILSIANRNLLGSVTTWTDTGGWKANGMALPSPLLVIGYQMVVRRWKDNRPIDITTYPLPDVEQLNSQIPVNEWEKGRDGEPRPPYALTYKFYFASMNGALFTYANSTFGCKLCYDALEESVTVRRLLQGVEVWPIVLPSQCPWHNQKYGDILRPHLEIIDWRELPGAGASSVRPLTGPTPAAAAIPPAQTKQDDPPWNPSSTAAPASPSAGTPKLAPIYPPATPSAAAAAAKAAAAQAPLLANTKPVRSVTTAEAIADELPPHSAPPKQDDGGWR
jgi:hypothetical protein